MGNTRNVIELRDVVQRYEGFRIDRVSFCVPEGAICGLVGPSGSGKTTIIKAILRVIDVELGEVSVLGRSVKNKTKKLREDIGVVLGEADFPERLTARDINIMMRNIYKKWDSKIYYACLERFSVPVKRPCEELSGGAKRVIQLAVALSHHAKLLVMDEPLVGIDPTTQKEILKICREYASDEHHTVLISAQSVNEIEAITDAVVYLQRGRITKKTGLALESEEDDGWLID